MFFVVSHVCPFLVSEVLSNVVPSICSEIGTNKTLSRSNTARLFQTRTSHFGVKESIFIDPRTDLLCRRTDSAFGLPKLRITLNNTVWSIQRVYHTPIDYATLSIPCNRAVDRAGVGVPRIGAGCDYGAPKGFPPPSRTAHKTTR